MTTLAENQPALDPRGAPLDRRFSIAPMMDGTNPARFFIYLKSLSVPWYTSFALPFANEDRHG